MDLNSNGVLSLYSVSDGSDVNYRQFLTPILQFQALRLRTYVNAYPSLVFRLFQLYGGLRNAVSAPPTFTLSTVHQ